MVIEASTSVLYRRFQMCVIIRNMTITDDIDNDMDDTQAYKEFLSWRWPPDGDPICPRCNCLAIYTCQSRRIFKCKGCNAQFSATTDTFFANRKLPYEKIIKFIKNTDTNILKISKEIGVDYNTAWRKCKAITMRDGVISNKKIINAIKKSKEKCVRCNKTRRELSRLPYSSVVTGVAFSNGYCPSCYSLRLRYGNDEELCEIYELTQYLKRLANVGNKKHC